jgi:hypothetical protein
MGQFAHSLLQDPESPRSHYRATKITLSNRRTIHKSSGKPRKHATMGSRSEITWLEKLEEQRELDQDLSKPSPSSPLPNTHD